jgi:hypothetical protein
MDRFGFKYVMVLYPTGTLDTGLHELRFTFKILSDFLSLISVILDSAQKLER